MNGVILEAEVSYPTSSQWFLSGNALHHQPKPRMWKLLDLDALVAKKAIKSYTPDRFLCFIGLRELETNEEVRHQIHSMVGL